MVCRAEEDISAVFGRNGRFRSYTFCGPVSLEHFCQWQKCDCLRAPAGNPAERPGQCPGRGQKGPVR